AVGIDVDGFPDHPDVSQNHAAVIPKKFVVIAGHVNYLGAALGFSQNRAEDIVMRLRPEQPPLHLEHIDNVADQIEEVAFNGAQEVEQTIGAAAPKSKMDVGNPDGSNSQNHLPEKPWATTNRVNFWSRTLYMVAVVCYKEMNVLVKKCEE